MLVGTKSNRSSRFFIGGVLLVLAALLAACEFPFGKDCALARPFDISPSFGEIVDTLTPTIYWDYDGPCAPDGFEISLGTSHVRTEDDITETVDASTGSWTPPGPLEPATLYRIRLRAVRGSMDGPVGFSGFRTGPVCAVGVPSAYPAPTLLSPENGAVISEAATYSPAPGEEWTTPLLDFAWEGESGCVTPNGYLLQISRFASFSPAWATTELRSYENIAWHEFAPGEEWHDCQRYFWRVTPWLGDELFGPNSETWSFVINTSGALCPLELGEPIIEPEGPGIPFPVSGHAAIAGHVWHDECAVPWESTDVAPPGCVIMPDGSMEANGVLDSGESGIEGVTVLLDDQPCPGTDGWSEETDASGYYSFHNLTAGTYCLEINAASDGNEDVLIPGSWTVPYRWYGPGPISAEVFLGSDDDISRMNDFAWDYQFLPAPSAVTPSGTPFARVIENARCRSGPGVFYPLVTFVSQGQSFPIQGRNAEASWWWIDRLDGDCWLADSVIETEGDTSSVPEQQAPPTPTVTPVLGCWQQPNPQYPPECVMPCPPEVQNPSYCTP